MKITTAAVLLPALAVGCSRLENRVTVTNETDSAVEDITLAVCDSTWSIRSLAAGESISFSVVYVRDDHFRVSSSELNGDFGYVTHGMTGDRAEITFRDGSIEFRQTDGGY